MLAHQPSKVTCLVIEPFVKLYGVDAVTTFAKSHGYTDAEIEAIKKRCIQKK